LGIPNRSTFLFIKKRKHVDRTSGFVLEVTLRKLEVPHVDYSPERVTPVSPCCGKPLYWQIS
jgi:hypothetical protein